MSSFQVVSCRVDLGGEHLTIVARGPSNPVTLPELIVLEYLHGSENITHVQQVGFLQRDPREEFERLKLTYPKRAIEACFPGARPVIPRKDKTIPVKTKDEADPVSRATQRAQVPEIEPEDLDESENEDSENPFEDEPIPLEEDNERQTQTVPVAARARGRPRKGLPDIDTVMQSEGNALHPYGEGRTAAGEAA